jgi:hypothetical protein
VAQYLERQQEAQLIFYDYKEKLEGILYLPELLMSERDRLPQENEDISLEKDKVSTFDLERADSKAGEPSEDTLNIQISQVKFKSKKQQAKRGLALPIDHSAKRDSENSQIALFKLLRGTVEDPDTLAQVFNGRMAADAILQIDCKELNENVVKQEVLLNDLEEELRLQKHNLKVNQDNQIDHKTYEEREVIKAKDFVDVEAIQDTSRREEAQEA